MTQDLPQHARERLAEMRAKKLFTSDLSVSEFLLVKEAGFDPLGLVMGSSIYQIAPTIPPRPRAAGLRDHRHDARALPRARAGDEPDGRKRPTRSAPTASSACASRCASGEPDEAGVDRSTASGRTGRTTGFPRSSTMLGQNWQSWPQVAAAHVVALLLAARVVARARRAVEPAQAQTGYALRPERAEFLAIGAPCGTAAERLPRTSTASRSSPI
jgi:hypothetical protein